MKATVLVLPHIVNFARHILLHVLHVIAPGHNADWIRIGGLEMLVFLLCLGFLTALFVAIKFRGGGRRKLKVSE